MFKVIGVLLLGYSDMLSTQAKKVKFLASGHSLMYHLLPQRGVIQRSNVYCNISHGILNGNREEIN